MVKKLTMYIWFRYISIGYIFLYNVCNKNIWDYDVFFREIMTVFEFYA